MIGIGVTVHNRNDLATDTIKRIRELLPVGAKLVIVDDASTVPFEGATFRFDKNVGIATAKNKCLELLDDCDHIFLFDDDCYPMVKNWWKAYVDSPEPHLCYIFKDFVSQALGDCTEIYRDDEIIAYSHVRGCMVYIDHSVLDKVGGLDNAYKRWGYEHVDWSNRIFNAGLTRFRYMDVLGSDKIFYSHDEQQTAKTSVPITERVHYLSEMRDHFDKSFKSSDYCEYKPHHDIFSDIQDNVILTAYITGIRDTQRGKAWEPNEKDVLELVSSVEKAKQRLVVINNCDWNGIKSQHLSYENKPASVNPYFQRWIWYYQWLREHDEIGFVWLVDATDVELLKDPFDGLSVTSLYTGYEPKFVACDWMYAKYQHRLFKDLFDQYGHSTLLNAGLVGGYRATVLEFLRKMIAFYTDNFNKIGKEDMGMFNYVAYMSFNDRLHIGDDINTEFKAFDNKNKQAIWRHK